MEAREEREEEVDEEEDSTYYRGTGEEVWLWDV
jgi:hypothetical protein